MAVNTRIGGLGAASGTGDASTWLDIQGVSSLRAGANANDAGTVRKVAQQFESMFLGMMLKSMRDAKLADSPFDSDESRLYQDMYDKQVSLGLTQGRGLGIADMLVRQLAPASGANAAGAPAVGALASRSRGGVAAHAPAAPGPVTPAPRTGPQVVRGVDARASAASTFSTTVPASLDASLDGYDPLLAGVPDARRGEYDVARAVRDGLPAVTPAAIAAAPSRPTAAATVDGVRTGAPDATPSSRTPGARAAHTGSARPFASTPEEFVRKVLPHARAAAAELGVSADAIVAQAALETGWGRSVPASADGAGHNLFGIKATGDWNGSRVGRATLEVTDGMPVRVQAAFRAYDTVADGFRDYVGLLSRSSRYEGVRAAGTDPARFAHALQSGGYATDPHYARKILAIVNGSTLRDAMAAAERPQTLLALKTDPTPPIT